MKLRTAIQVLTTLVVLAFANYNSCSAGGNGFGVINQDAKLNFTETPIEDICTQIALDYDVSVFLEKGIEVNVSSDETHSKLGADLGRMLKPLDLHVHADSLGIFITRKPIPYSVTHLAGDVELKLVIPAGRQQTNNDDRSARWEQGDSVISAGWEKIGDKSLRQVAQDELKMVTTAYKSSPKQTTLKKDGKDYLATQIQIPAKMSFNRKKRKVEEREMVSDCISFKNGDYLYVVTHTYPRASSKEGAMLSKRLMDSIHWRQFSKYKRFGRK